MQDDRVCRNDHGQQPRATSPFIAHKAQFEVRNEQWLSVRCLNFAIKSLTYSRRERKQAHVQVPSKPITSLPVRARHFLTASSRKGLRRCEPRSLTVSSPRWHEPRHLPTVSNQHREDPASSLQFRRQPPRSSKGSVS